MVSFASMFDGGCCRQLNEVRASRASRHKTSTGLYQLMIHLNNTYRSRESSLLPIVRSLQSATEKCHEKQLKDEQDAKIRRYGNQGSPSDL